MFKIPGKIPFNTSCKINSDPLIEIVQLSGTFNTVAVIAPTIIKPKQDADLVNTLIKPELKIFSMNVVP